MKKIIVLTFLVMCMFSHGRVINKCKVTAKGRDIYGEGYLICTSYESGKIFHFEEIDRDLYQYIKSGEVYYLDFFGEGNTGLFLRDARRIR